MHRRETRREVEAATTPRERPEAAPPITREQRVRLMTVRMDGLLNSICCFGCALDAVALWMREKTVALKMGERETTYNDEGRQRLHDLARDTYARLLERVNEPEDALFVMGHVMEMVGDRIRREFQE